MKSSNSYLQLLIKLSAVMVVVLAVSMYNQAGSTDVHAQEGLAGADTVVRDVATVTPAPAGEAETVEKEPSAVVDKNDVSTDDPLQEVPEDGDEEEPVIEGDDVITDNEHEISGTVLPRGYRYIDPNEGENTPVSGASIAATVATSAEYPDYIASLLVTSPDHYDAEVVERALSIPVDDDNARYRYITGVDKRRYVVGDMPAGYRNDAEASGRMVTVDVPVWKMDAGGKKFPAFWPLTINEKLVDSVRCIFSDIFLLDIKFPYNYLSGYKFRKVGGVGLVNSRLMSTHAFGVAIDINMGDYDNDYFLGKGNDLRDKDNPYCIPDEVIEIFERYGWFWGGNYEICADTMHFQYYELGFLQYEHAEPFPILYRGASGMSGQVIRNLTQRLVELGYLDKETYSFTAKVDKAVKAFQADQGLKADGVVNYATWEPLINLTHYMSYVF